MFNVVNNKDELIASFNDFNDAKKFAEERSFYETVYLDTDRYDIEYPKKERRPKNGN